MVSMSGKGDCGDNAPMESANGTLKVECVNDQHFKTRTEAERDGRVYWLLQYRAQTFGIGVCVTGRIRAALARRNESGDESNIAMMWCRVAHRRPVSGWLA